MDASAAAALTFLTDFGDQAVILPLVSVVALVLWAQRRWRVAAAWLLAIPAVLGTVLVLKIACYACGWLVPALGPGGLALRSPSGHAASAAVAYGGLAALLAARTRLASRLGLGVGPGRAAAVTPVSAVSARALTAALVTALGVAALIGTTRVQLGAHSLSEVLLAAAVGVAGAVAFARLAGPHVAERSSLPVAAGALLVLVVFHGRHLPAESVIQATASETLRRLITVCAPG